MGDYLPYLTHFALNNDYVYRAAYNVENLQTELDATYYYLQDIANIESFYDNLFSNIKIDFTPITTINNPIGGSIIIGDGNGDVVGGGRTNTSGVGDPTKTTQNEKQIFERKARLLLKIDPDNQAEINKIRQKIGKNYKEGIKKLDALIKGYDSFLIKPVVENLYKEDLDNKEKSGKQIGDSWATTISVNSSGDFKVDTGSLSKSNVLDVLGAFVKNEGLAEGDWNVLIGANYGEIARCLILKANDFKKNVDETTKTTIENLMHSMNEDSPQSVYELFITLRKLEATALDKDVQARYGVPNDKIDGAITSATDRVDKEKTGYENIKKTLDTNG